MDSLTVRYLARELDVRWKQRRVRGISMDRVARAVVVEVGEDPPVRVDLSTPDVRVHWGVAAVTGNLLQGWTVRGVHAPDDDRRLLVDLEHPGRFRGSANRLATLEISAVPSARAAFVRAAGGHVMASLGARMPHRGAPRPVLDRATINAAIASGDLQALLEGRWMSAFVAQWLLRDPARAADRYAFVCGADVPAPTWCGEQLLPFPLCDDGLPAASLIAPPARAVAAAVREGGEDRAERARRRMRAELERAREAPRVRAAADALVGMGHAAAPARVSLEDGTIVDVMPRAGETAVVAAARLYATVRSMERALAQLPGRIAAATSRTTAPAPQWAQAGGRGVGERGRVFRTYRSSGGLDIWVGRGAVSNDALTFHVATPNEVWLHARDNAGAHVVLRWRASDPPPPRDLEEAAMLAAWHSKSRGSAVVPVDWTRRKYVRKPRGAAPGLVTLQQCQTIFVRPDARAERAMRSDGTAHSHD